MDLKDIKLLIIPDVHGRDFWREAVKANLDKKIVFLGDYLSPYPFEWNNGEDYNLKAIEVFKEIIDLKEENDNITLLLGNHDMGILDERICRSRMDMIHHYEIYNLLTEKLDNFDMAYETSINKKRFLLSHSGVRDEWIDVNRYIFPKGFKPSAKKFNDFLHTDDMATRRKFFYALSDVSGYRGGLEGSGSMVWADVQEYLHELDNGKKTIQIFSHTMLNDKAINLNDRFYCLDCKKVFYIDSKGDIRYYDTDEIVGKTNI